MKRMILLYAFTFVLSCTNASKQSLVDSTAALKSVVDTMPSFGESLQPSSYHDKLGINFTWAADQRITGDPAFASKSFRHVRFFQMMEKDFGDGIPAMTELAPCEDLENPWSCPEQSLKQHLVRLKALRAMFPGGYIWVAPEVLKDRSWPCKGWNVEELGVNPREAGYRWGRAALATYGQLQGVILAMTNEEWCNELGRVNAYNEWRRGIIDAHKENPSCQLAIGARHVRARTWNGSRMPDHVGDVASDVWTYVDSVNGWADYHAHGIEDGKFLSHENAHKATDYADFTAWASWLRLNYPNIRKSVGEIAYTTSEPGIVATQSEKLEDWPTYKSLIKRLADHADLVFLYQIEDHNHPEGAFSGSGVYPALMDSIATFGLGPLHKKD